MTYNGKHSGAYNYIASKYVFRFNVVTSFYEYQEKRFKKKDRVWKKYDDRTKNKILFDLVEEFIEVPAEKVNGFIETEQFSPDYNPFLDYFSKLKKFKKSDESYIDKFSKTIETSDPDRFKNLFKRFLVGTIDCLLNPDAVNDVCLVFQSGQGVGKSRWMRSLLPEQFRTEYMYEGSIDTRNKDHNIYLSQYWFIHLDELETLRNNEIGAIKSYITRQRITERKAYGRYSSVFVRRASFLGSVNDDKFLSDITGNRRWLVCTVNSINYTHGLDSDRLWAEAYALYKDKFRYWFNPDEIAGLNEANDQYRNISLEEELLVRYFEFNDANGSGEFLSSSHIIEKIILENPTLNAKMSSFVLGKALSRHTKRRRILGGLQHYWVHFTGQVDLESKLKKNTKKKNKKKKKKPSEEDILPF